jgi:hypothetical protein
VESLVTPQELEAKAKKGVLAYLDPKKVETMLKEAGIEVQNVGGKGMDKSEELLLEVEKARDDAKMARMSRTTSQDSNEGSAFGSAAVSKKDARNKKEPAKKSVVINVIEARKSMQAPRRPPAQFALKELERTGGLSIVTGTASSSGTVASSSSSATSASSSTAGVKPTTTKAVADQSETAGSPTDPPRKQRVYRKGDFLPVFDWGIWVNDIKQECRLKGPKNLCLRFLRYHEGLYDEKKKRLRKLAPIFVPTYNRPKTALLDYSSEFAFGVDDMPMQIVVLEPSQYEAYYE